MCAEIFLPCPDGLLVNLHERKDQIKDLLNRLPGLFAKNYESASAAGAAMQIAFKLMVRRLVYSTRNVRGLRLCNIYMYIHLLFVFRARQEVACQCL